MIDKVRQGDLTFTRDDFVMQALGPMIASAFTVPHISGGFSRTGLWPINHTIVITELLNKQTKHSQPMFPGLLPDFSSARDQRGVHTMSRLIDFYAPIVSAPTRAGLSDEAAMVSESILLRDRLHQEGRVRHRRLEGRHAKLSQSKSKPDGEVYGDQSLEDMRQKPLAEDKAEREKAYRRIQRIKQAEENKVKREEATHKTAVRKQLQQQWKNQQKTHDGVKITLTNFLTLHAPDFWPKTESGTGEAGGEAAVDAVKRPTTPETQLIPDPHAVIIPDIQDDIIVQIQSEQDFIPLVSDSDGSDVDISIESMVIMGGGSRPLRDLEPLRLRLQDQYLEMDRAMDEAGDCFPSEDEPYILSEDDMYQSEGEEVMPSSPPVPQWQRHLRT